VWLVSSLPSLSQPTKEKKKGKPRLQKTWCLPI
jgi:hypothetical protein